MADVVLDAPPFTLVKPKLTLGATGNQIQYECSANEIEAVPEQDSTDNETFCGVFTSYKPEKWTITVTVLQSYGTDGFWTNVRPMANTVQPFTLLPDSTKPVGPDNPEMSGDAYIPGFAFVSAAVGEASEFDFVLNVQGDPVFSETPVGTQSAPSGGGGASAAAA